MKYSFENFVKNSTLESEKETLQADNITLLAKVKEIETKLTEADKTISAFPLAKKDWDGQIEKVKADHSTAIDILKKEYQAKIDSLTTELAATKVSLNKEVVAQLSSVGIDAGIVKEEKAKAVSSDENNKPILNPSFRFIQHK